MPAITVNDQSMDITSACSLEELLSVLGKEASGLAIAVNEKVISKDKWPEFRLEGGESILLITAAQGG